MMKNMKNTSVMPIWTRMIITICCSKTEKAVHIIEMGTNTLLCASKSKRQTEEVNGRQTIKKLPDQNKRSGSFCIEIVISERCQKQNLIQHVHDAETLTNRNKLHTMIL